MEQSGKRIPRCNTPFIPILPGYISGSDNWASAAKLKVYLPFPAQL
jgi:hypothetical protein